MWEVGMPKTGSGRPWEWCGLDKMAFSMSLNHLMESNGCRWTNQVIRGFGKQWELGSYVCLRFFSQSWLWILTNSCRNTHSPCLEVAVIKPKQSPYVKMVLNASYSIKGSGYKKDRPALKKKIKSLIPTETRHVIEINGNLVLSTCE